MDKINWKIVALVVAAALAYWWFVAKKNPSASDATNPEPNPQATA